MPTPAVPSLNETLCDSIEIKAKHVEHHCESKEKYFFDSRHHQGNQDRVPPTTMPTSKDDDTTPLDHTSLVRLLQRINRERDELALLLVQQSSEAVAMKAQADLLPQYRQGGSMSIPIHLLPTDPLSNLINMLYHRHSFVTNYTTKRDVILTKLLLSTRNCDEEIQRTRQELLQWKEMCRQERQQGTLLQQKLQRALKALMGTDRSDSNNLSADSTTAQNSGTVQKPGTATMMSAPQNPRQSVATHESDRNSGSLQKRSRSLQSRGVEVQSRGVESTNGTASLQAALSPIRLLAHQLAQSGEPPSLSCVIYTPYPII